MHAKLVWFLEHSIAAVNLDDPHDSYANHCSSNSVRYLNLHTGGGSLEEGFGQRASAAVQADIQVSYMPHTLDCDRHILSFDRWSQEVP